MDEDHIKDNQQDYQPQKQSLPKQKTTIIKDNVRKVKLTRKNPYPRKVAKVPIQTNNFEI